MTERRVNLLHVEDDEMQRRLIGAHLAHLEGLRFNIVYAATENEAADAFTRARFDVVILDYHLERGNGLRCLQKIRRRDPIVAIIAISGAANPTIAADLLRAGADDFLAKADLNTQVLADSVHAALVRTDRWRRHIPDEPDTRNQEMEAGVRKLCDQFITALGSGWLNELDAVAASIQKVGLDSAALSTLLELAISDADTRGPAAGQAQRFLRPLLVELLTRQAESAARS